LVKKHPGVVRVPWQGNALEVEVVDILALLEIAIEEFSDGTDVPLLLGRTELDLV
jgi:hypothetical protein